jgi:hypothetical protein
MAGLKGITKGGSGFRGSSEEVGMGQMASERSE